MNRSVLGIGALLLSMTVCGCGGGGGTPVSRAEDPRLPSEVREYEARNARRLAERATAKPGRKPGQYARTGR